MYQRAVPHQGEPSSAGQTRFSSLVAAPGHGGLNQRWTAKRHANQQFGWSCYSVRGAGMGRTASVLALALILVKGSTPMMVVVACQAVPPAPTPSAAETRRRLRR